MAVLFWLLGAAIVVAYVTGNWLYKLVADPRQHPATFLGFLKARAQARTGWPQAPLPIQKPEPLTPEPDQVEGPNFGNIRATLEPLQPADDLFERVHVFPDRRSPVTRYEEFNWRLFTYTDTDHPLQWPETTVDDYPTELRGSTARIQQAIEERLRPAYPVILDTYGWFAKASDELELNPNYADAAVEAYLALPADQRPVIVSRRNPAPPKDPTLLFMRYGFEPFAVRRSLIQINFRISFDTLFQAFIGPREPWLWFSVARMRKIVVGLNHEATATNQYLANQTRIATEVARSQRFGVLWNLRVPDKTEALAADISANSLTIEAVEDQEPEEQPTSNAETQP